MKLMIYPEIVWSRVVADEEIDKFLYELLAVEVESAKYSKLYRQGLWDGKKRFYDQYRKRFLTGLLPFVESKLIQAGLDFEVVGRERVFRSFEVDVSKIHLNDIDEERFMKVQFPLLQEIGKRGRCSVRLATGGGKTEVMAGLCSLLRDKRFLILVHRIELLEQTRKRLQERLGEKVGKIDSNDIDLKKRIVVGMVWSTLSKVGNVYDWLKNDVDGLLIDECHHSGADTWKRIAMMCNAPIRVGFSGTPITKKVDRDMWLVGLTGEVIEGLRVSDLVELGYAVRPVVRVVVDDRLVFGDWRRKWGKKYFDVVRMVYSDLKVLDVIGEIVRAHSESGLVVFVDRLEVGYNILKYLKDVLKVDKVEFSHGNVQQFKRLQIFSNLKKGKLQVLIATPILDEGIDVSGITGVLFACSNKSVVKVMQRIGRGVRIDVSKDVVYVYDLNVLAPWLFDHLQSRIKLYSEEDFVVEFCKIKQVEGDYVFERIY